VSGPVCDPSSVRHLPTILLILSFPAGVAGYFLGARVVSAVAPGETILAIFVPLFVAGLCMMPLLVPFLDRKAKADLEAHRREVGAVDGGEVPAVQAPDAAAVARRDGPSAEDTR
jgi:hypothetical protein